MKSILDPTFRYTPSVGTDIRKTFARIRREQCTNDSGEAVAVERKTNSHDAIRVPRPDRSTAR